MNLVILKKNAKKNLKNNYFKNVIVVFICTLLISGTINLSSKNILNMDLKDVKNVKDVDIKNIKNIDIKSIDITNIDILNNTYKSNSEIIDELFQKINKKNNKKEIVNIGHDIISIIVNELTTTKSYIFSFLNSINKFLGGHISASIVIVISNILFIIFNTLFVSVFEIGKNRYFLEERKYLKTGVDRVLFPYKKRKTIHLAYILFLKKLYLFLYTFTIIGFFIKYYEYSMIPYILAENPNISKKDAFRLSKDLTNGYKLYLFKLDLSLIGYRSLGLFTFNLSNYFFTDIYVNAIYAEVYMYLRDNKYSSLKDLLSDELLNIKDSVNEAYPDSHFKLYSLFNIDYLRDYSLNSYVLLFFCFSIFGWLWEVVLHLVQTGYLVNRGSFHGPWLPIYGFGGIAILFLLKKYRASPEKLFILSVILCGFIEYFTAWYLETFKHLKYWDYTNYFLNLDGRICLEGLVVFGLGGCAFTYIFAPIFDNLFSKIRIHLRNYLVIILLAIFSLDFVYSTFVSSNIGNGIAKEININEKNIN